MSEKAFSFLDMPNRSTKPRVDGMTMCIDQGLGFDFVKGFQGSERFSNVFKRFQVFSKEFGGFRGF